MENEQKLSAMINQLQKLRDQILTTKSNNPQQNHPPQHSHHHTSPSSHHHHSQDNQSTHSGIVQQASSGAATASSNLPTINNTSSSNNSNHNNNGTTSSSQNQSQQQYHSTNKVRKLLFLYAPSQFSINFLILQSYSNEIRCNIKKSFYIKTDYSDFVIFIFHTCKVLCMMNYERVCVYFLCISPSPK